MKTNPTNSATKPRADDPMLVSLWRADAVLRIAGQVDGPRGYRSALAGESRSRGELPEEAIIDALNHQWAVSLVPFDDARRIVALAMMTRQARPLYAIRDISAKLGISKSSTHRKLRLGLYFTWCLLMPLQSAQQRQRALADQHRRAA